MTVKEFKRDYLRQYCLIEKDFQNTIDYVSISPLNYSTYSPTYLKILLSIGSEVDVLKEFICNLYKVKKKDFASVEKDFHSVVVEVWSEAISLTPWETTGSHPVWWTIYNEVKHNRNEYAEAEGFDSSKRYFQYANLENVLNALAGLLALEMLAYKKVAEENGEERWIPSIHSIFQMKNLYWKDIDNGRGYVMINGDLYIDPDMG